MVWHFIEYPRQNVSGENMYVCFGAIIWIWTLIAHGFALSIGMGVKSAVELIYHLSFLGVKKKWTTNSIQVRGNFEFKSQEKNNWHFLYRNGRWGWLSEWSVSWADWWGHSKQQCFTDSFLLWYWDANWIEITGEFLNRLEFELKSTGEVKDKLAKEKDELTRDSKRLKHALKNPTFDISKFKEKDEDIEFYTGLLHWNALVLLNDM